MRVKLQLREVNIIREGDKQKNSYFGLQRLGFTIGEEKREKKRKKRKKTEKEKKTQRSRYVCL